MPELPEAETIVRDLRGRVTGDTITGVRISHRDVLGPTLTPQKLARAVCGRRITGVARRGKNVVLELDGGGRLVINLGMTGRVVASEARRAAELTHVAVRFDLDAGRALLYDDVRRFGRVDFYDARAWQARSAELGLEPLSDELTPEALFRLLRTSRVPIRNWLLDQRHVAGVGNIYATEALYRAGVRPTRRAHTLTRAEATRLRHELRQVLEEAIVARGTTISDYRDAAGEAGGFEPLLRVYGREGEPCPRCGTAFKRIVITNRSAYYCPKCQR